MMSTQKLVHYRPPIEEGAQQDTCRLLIQPSVESLHWIRSCNNKVLHQRTKSDSVHKKGSSDWNQTKLVDVQEARERTAMTKLRVSFT